MKKHLSMPSDLKACEPLNYALKSSVKRTKLIRKILKYEVFTTGIYSCTRLVQLEFERVKPDENRLYWCCGYPA